MRNTIAVARREFAAYFNSPIAYILVTLYIVTAGYLFFRTLFISRQADLRPFFEIMPLLFTIIVPFVTMRSIAEERREGTLELLLTLPLTDLQLLLGKFLAALGLMAVLLLLTSSLAFSVASVGTLDWGSTIAGYIGALLMAGAFVAIGIMSSTFLRSQIGAALLAFFIGFVLFLAGAVVQQLPPFWQTVAHGISISSHFMNIARGVIDTRDVLYYVSMICACLLVAHATLESRRWR